MSLSSRFSYKNSVYIPLLCHSCYMPCSFLTSLHDSNYIIGEYRSLISLCNFLRPPTISPSWVQIFSLAPNEYSQTISENNFYSHPYKTEDKIKFCVGFKGFHRWCMTLVITGLLGFVHRPLF